MRACVRFFVKNVHSFDGAAATFSRPRFSSLSPAVAASHTATGHLTKPAAQQWPSETTGSYNFTGLSNAVDSSRYSVDHTAAPISVDFKQTSSGSDAPVYRGVLKKGHRWQAVVSRQYLSTFSSAEEAALCVDQVQYALMGDAAPLNFPSKPYAMDPKVWRLSALGVLDKMALAVREEQPPRHAHVLRSRYRGVGVVAPRTYKATIQCNRQKVLLGFFEEEAAAARCWDMAALRVKQAGVALNCPELKALYCKQLERYNGLDDRQFLELYRRQFKHGTVRPDSGTTYIGVSWHKRLSLYEAKIKLHNHLHHLGTFLDSKEAARMYDRAVIWFGLLEERRTNFECELYKDDSLLGFCQMLDMSREQFIETCKLAARDTRGLGARRQLKQFNLRGD